MCGFLFSCSLVGPIVPSADLLKLLGRRGPDGLKVTHRTILVKASPSADSYRELHLLFAASVLSLRGEELLPQPLQDESTGSLFLWNGEAWSVNGKGFSGNDADYVFRSLLSCVQESHQSGLDFRISHISCLDAVKKVVGSTRGPFSYLFYEATSKCIFYGRDRLGRRSLLYKRESTQGLSISSVSDGLPHAIWEEVDVSGVYMVDLDSERHLSPDIFHKTRTIKEPSSLTIDCIPWTAFTDSIPRLNRNEPPSKDHPTIQTRSQAVIDLKRRLRLSLETRLTNIGPHPCEAIGAPLIAILFSGGVDCTVLARLAHDIIPLDQSIDLLNVAFENPRVIAAARERAAKEGKPMLSIPSAYEACPDRVTGSKSYAELLARCGGREWRFVTINVPFDEVRIHREQVKSLMYPHDTEMDLSISLALYFAAKGHGMVSGFAGEEPYTSPARVLISGLGADELFGGYKRHATAFARKGYDGLWDELELDFSRLPKRNLGRDDRIISHWGREIRYPYLDDDLVRWVLQRPVWEKCDFRPTASVSDDDLFPEGGKLVLRLLAVDLGMDNVAQEKKRAIQFGARTAKMIDGSTKGTDTTLS